MYRLEKLHLIMAYLLQATGTGSYGQMTPLNAVAEVGGEAIFNCSGTTLAPHWLMSRDGTSANLLTIALNCNVESAFQNNYKTEQIEGPNSCNLIVFEVTMKQAGAYRCAEFDTSYALLTVIDKSPAITQNDTQGVVVENENVIVTCTSHHNGSVAPAPTLQPYFYWTNSVRQNVSSSYYSTTENTAVSQITVTAGRQDITGYTCHVYLKLNATTDPFYATNTPTVSNSVTTTPINVMYPPSNAKIVATSAGLIACEAKDLTCHSDANPPPIYIWVDLTSGNVTNEEKIFAECGVNYTCCTSNSIRNVTYVNSSTFYEDPIKNITCNGLYLMEAYKSINISGCYYSPNTTTENVLQSNCSSAEIAAIVLGVLLAISIAVNIFGFVLFYRKGAVKKKDSNEPEMTHPSSQSQEPHYQDPSHETWAKPEYEELHH